MQIVVNRAKGRISKRVFQENKARQIFRKTNFSYPLIRTRTYNIDNIYNIELGTIFTYFKLYIREIDNVPIMLGQKNFVETEELRKLQVIFCLLNVYRLSAFRAFAEFLRSKQDKTAQFEKSILFIIQNLSFSFKNKNTFEQICHHLKSVVQIRAHEREGK